MALKQVRIGSLDDVFQYDDGDFTEAIETTEPISIGSGAGASNAVRRDEMPGGFAGVSGNVTMVTQIQAGGAGAIGFQYKDRTLTFTDGVLTVIGAESGWNDI